MLTAQVIGYIPLIFPPTKMLDYCGLRTIILCGSFLNALAACIKIACAEQDRFWLLLTAQVIGYIPLIFPRTKMLDYCGLRTIILCGSFLNALAACIKIACAEQDRFWLLLTAQVIASLAQVFTLGMPPKVAATWFHGRQVSTATACGVFGNQLGNALGFLMPVNMVPSSSSSSVSETRAGLFKMYLAMGLITSVIFILSLVFFDAKPKTPPSAAQHAFELHRNQKSKEPYYMQIKTFLNSRTTILLTVSYGILTGVFYAVTTLLAQEVLFYFPGHDTDVGNLGLVIIFTGLVGAIIGGVLLDRTKRFKLVSLTTYVFSVLGLVMFVVVLSRNRMWLIYVASGVMGFFLSGYLAIGFEFAAELTFPTSEDVTGGTLNACAQIVGIVLILVMGHIIDVQPNGILYANVIMVVLLSVGCFLIVFIKEELRRFNASIS
uniref:Major facilitator superfamily (MFS) profile domain-containing protein n=1 Tax=Mucochytrium quahogii TaxID=96639 RepID=A0A7S2R8P7_9STRA